VVRCGGGACCEGMSGVPSCHPTVVGAATANIGGRMRSGWGWQIERAQRGGSVVRWRGQ
jgi:hypothetical protein